MIAHHLRVLVTAAVLAGSALPAQALLVNGGFESPLTPPGWTLTESVTGAPQLSADATDLSPFYSDADFEAPGVLWLKAFAGNTATPVVGQNKLVNATLSQTAPVMAGQNYVFRGHSKWESNYSGGVTTLDPGSPSGAAPSPTQTTFEMQFLDGAGAPMGPATVLDLRTVQSNFEFWQQHSMNATAPVGAASVRVSAVARDMAFNVDPSQSAFFDLFSLTRASAPATELLVNGNLNAPGFVPGWQLTESPPDTDNLQLVSTFAAQSGARGMWVKAFMEGNAEVSQTVAALPGVEYTFSGWSKWEGGYSGGVTTLDPLSPYGATASPTSTFFEMTFLDANDDIIGVPLTLDLRTEQMNDATWRQHFLTGVAPLGAAKIRVAAAATDLRTNVDIGGQSAFFDDFALTSTAVPESRAWLMGGVVCAAAAVNWLWRGKSSGHSRV